jgi:hypothetical protein
MTSTIPAISVLYRFCCDELTAIFPTLPGTYALDIVESFTWADSFVSLDLAYAASGTPAGRDAYHRMHAYLVKRFENDAVLTIIDAIEHHHHDARHAQLRSSIAAMKKGKGSPPWTPAGLEDLRASAAALS